MSVSWGRWLTKKLARHGTAFGMAGIGAVAARSRLESSPGVRALMYHRFGASIRDPFCVDVQSFEKQIRWLARKGLVISVDQLVAFIQCRQDVPRGSFRS